jgi:serine protease Do
VVQDVTPGSPAERAGLRPYDVIAALDGQAISTGDELIAMVSARRPGDTVTLQLTRDGRDTSALVKLAERPVRDRTEDAPAIGRVTRPGVPRLGLSVRTLESDVARRLGAPADVRGVVVWRVDTVGAASDADVERGDVILEIDRRPIRSVDDYDQAVAQARPGDVLAFYVYKPSVDERRLSTVRIDDVPRP